MNNKEKISQLQEYYNCIIRVDYFKKHLDVNDELYYRKAIEDWRNYRNANLLKHDVLSSRKGWLVPFNNRLANLLTKIVSNFKSVIEWKELQTELHPNTLEIVLSRHLEPLNEMVTGFRLNYDNDELLAQRMQQYCINGFKQMITFAKDELLIRIENAPYFKLIQRVIDNYENEINIEDVKLSILNRELNNNPEHKDETNKSRKYTAKHCALAYLFECDMNGLQPPKNDGGFAQKEIDSYGISNYNKKSLTKAVRTVVNYDRNNVSELNQISTDWREIVIELSGEPNKLDEYLKKKNL